VLHAKPFLSRFYYPETGKLKDRCTAVRPDSQWYAYGTCCWFWGRLQHYLRHRAAVSGECAMWRTTRVWQTKLPRMGKNWLASPAERNKLVRLGCFDYGPTWAQMLVDKRRVCRPRHIMRLESAVRRREYGQSNSLLCEGSD